jgi:hypothetical protein
MMQETSGKCNIHEFPDTRDNIVLSRVKNSATNLSKLNLITSGFYNHMDRDNSFTNLRISILLGHINFEAENNLTHFI